MSVDTYKGTLIAPATGTPPVRQNATGLPFAPRAVLFFSACAGTLNATQTGLMECFGAAVSAAQQFVVANASDGSGIASNAARVSRTTECVCLPLNGTPTIDALASFVALDGDGFTLDWADLAATSGQVVHYLAIGGEDILDAAIVVVTPSTTTNGVTQAITFGFRPDFVLTVSPAVPSVSGIVDANMCIGAAARLPSTQQYAAYWFENDGAANMDLSVYSAQNRMGAMPSSTAVKDADYSLASWDAAGITITWDDAPAALTGRVYMLGLRGGQYEFDYVSSPTSPGTQSISTAFAPKGVLLFGSSDPTDTDNTASASTADSQFTVGACDSGLRQGTNVFIQQDANATSVAKRRTSSSKATTWLTGTAGTLQAEAAISAISGSGYTLDWTSASATVRKLCGIAIGDSNPAPPFVFNNVPSQR
jgi:hypothetical protein